MATSSHTEIIWHPEATCSVSIESIADLVCATAWRWDSERCVRVLYYVSRTWNNNTEILHYFLYAWMYICARWYHMIAVLPFLSSSLLKQELSFVMKQHTHVLHARKWVRKQYPLAIIYRKHEDIKSFIVSQYATVELSARQHKISYPVYPSGLHICEEFNNGFWYTRMWVCDSKCSGWQVLWNVFHICQVSVRDWLSLRLMMMMARVKRHG